MVYALLIAAALAIWVYSDAKARNERQPVQWAIGTFLLAIVVLPLWLIKRPAKASTTTRPCPRCAEQIQSAAVACRFCGAAVEPVVAVPPLPSQPPAGMSRGFKWALGVLGAFVILVIVAAAFAPTPSTVPPASLDAVTVADSRPAPSAEWKEIASWSGSGIKETESFTTSSREWRVRWRTSNEVFTGAGIFQVMVYGSSGDLVTLAANKQGIGSDVSYVRTSPGRHHLTINSGNVDWDVAVEEQR